MMASSEGSHTSEEGNRDTSLEDKSLEDQVLPQNTVQSAHTGSSKGDDSSQENIPVSSLRSSTQLSTSSPSKGHSHCTGDTTPRCHVNNGSIQLQLLTSQNSIPSLRNGHIVTSLNGHVNSQEGIRAHEDLSSKRIRAKEDMISSYPGKTSCYANHTPQEVNSHQAVNAWISHDFVFFLLT